MSKIDALIEVLQREKEIYAGLLSISEDKKSLIVAGDTGKLSSMLKEETDLADEARTLEEKRIAIADSLAGQLGFQEDEISLRALAESTDDPALKIKLIRLRSDISEIVTKLVKYNNINKTLIKQRSDYVGAMLGSIIKSEPFGSFYNRGGSAGVYNTGAGFFDRQA
ncbi:MAG: flagellar protein FlgN [Oscillospiraceae bacterium]